jgi:hypothetical protein
MNAVTLRRVFIPNAALTTIIVFAIMLLLNLGLFFLALIRFQRAQLLLESALRGPRWC